MTKKLIATPLTLLCAIRKVIQSLLQVLEDELTSLATAVERKSVRPSSPAHYLIELDEYQIVNLRALIEAIGYPASEIPFANPLNAANTGDWLGEIYNKLPYTTQHPNLTALEMAQNALRHVTDTTIIISETGMAVQDRLER